MKAGKREPEQVSDSRRRKLRRYSRDAAEGEDDVAMPSGLQDSDGENSMDTGDARLGVSQGGGSSNQMLPQAAAKGRRQRLMNPSSGLPQHNRRGRHEGTENGGGFDDEDAADERGENVPATLTPGEGGEGGLRRDSQFQEHGKSAGLRVMPAAYVYSGMAVLHFDRLNRFHVW